MDCVCQRCHKKCSTRTCVDDYYCCWKSPNSNHLCDHGFMVSLACHTVINSLSWSLDACFSLSRDIYNKEISAVRPGGACMEMSRLTKAVSSRYKRKLWIVSCEFKRCNVLVWRTALKGHWDYDFLWSHYRSQCWTRSIRRTNERSESACTIRHSSLRLRQNGRYFNYIT